MVLLNFDPEVEAGIDSDMKTVPVVARLYGGNQHGAEVLFESVLLDPDGHLLAAVVVASEDFQSQNLVLFLFDPGRVHEGTIYQDHPLCPL